MEWIKSFLHEREKTGSLRVLQPADKKENGYVYIGEKKYLDFSSNDYLGLSTHPDMKKASIEAIKTFGTSVSGSRLLSGDFLIHHYLEEKIADFKNKESGLVFNSGYQANVGIIGSLPGKMDVIFCDKIAHASIIDGTRLSPAKTCRFLHNDMDHLEILLKKERNKFRNALVITETVFSMDGDVCPLKELVQLKNRYNCTLMVDEAHATGIFGRNGAGIVEKENLSENVDIIMGTFSKALGSFGAYIACSKKVKDYLVNVCRSFIYSTALPPSIVCANVMALEIVKKEPDRRKILLENAEYFRRTLKQKGFNVKGSTQIVPWIIGDSKKTVEAGRILQEEGYRVFPIRHPTVPKGQERLRFSLNYYHDKTILKKLCNDMSKHFKI
ncbi:MAG: 8-amino-7-oxononanoate synthase [Candidatus Omnitrophica bacterium]|nr:8-amino-7-oxononanoate synthase [Candidatus Omnitrophota bacterium]